MKYVARPAVVTAVQWTGKNEDEITKFLKGSTHMSYRHMVTKIMHYQIYVNGFISDVKINDYIVKDSDGSFTLLIPKLFIKTYKEFSDEILT